MWKQIELECQFKPWNCSSLCQPCAKVLATILGLSFALASFPGHMGTKQGWTFMPMVAFISGELLQLGLVSCLHSGRESLLHSHTWGEPGSEARLSGCGLVQWEWLELYQFPISCSFHSYSHYEVKEAKFFSEVTCTHNNHAVHCLLLLRPPSVKINRCSSTGDTMFSPNTISCFVGLCRKLPHVFTLPSKPEACHYNQTVKYSLALSQGCCAYSGDSYKEVA